MILQKNPIVICRFPFLPFTIFKAKLRLSSLVWPKKLFARVRILLIKNVSEHRLLFCCKGSVYKFLIFNKSKSTYHQKVFQNIGQ